MRNTHLGRTGSLSCHGKSDLLILVVAMSGMVPDHYELSREEWDKLKADGDAVFGGAPAKAARKATAKKAAAKKAKAATTGAAPKKAAQKARGRK